MRAKVTKSFDGRPDDEALTRTIAVGEIVAGDLAAVAVKEGWAVEERAPEAGSDSAPARKARRK